LQIRSAPVADRITILPADVTKADVTNWMRPSDGCP
jgi:hypothetical protein